ncbi:hypothetical protein M9979_00250 [Sphingomonas sp. RP10(2022)]|uniref:Alanine racemase N-terminal domain-containing protein n=1 Tax=Sphingomonas liriopis TaxID=2949094 RepID=A0A9X2KP79_9SPHN|nr:hypothetical protein [Sphingomonas liriopis]
MTATLADVTANLKLVKSRIAAAALQSGRAGDAARLVLVTKTIEPSRILEAVRAGQVDLGENRCRRAPARRKRWRKKRFAGR